MDPTFLLIAFILVSVLALVVVVTHYFDNDEKRRDMIYYAQFHHATILNKKDNEANRHYTKLRKLLDDSHEWQVEGLKFKCGVDRKTYSSEEYSSYLDRGINLATEVIKLEAEYEPIRREAEAEYQASLERMNQINQSKFSNYRF